ncbi:MAG: adenosine deaminase [bacterium]|nr:adenosine deaminase [bacterium]
MTTPFPEDRFRCLPKAEIHVHLEGSVGAETLLALAADHGVEPPAPDARGVRRWYSFRDFPDFLERYFFVCRLLGRAEDFRRIAYDYLLTAHAQGAVHVEFHISSSYHTQEVGLDWSVVLEGAVAGCEQAERECGISSLLIPDLSPHLGVASGHATLDAVLAQLHPRVVALGMGGPSDAWWEEDFAPAFERARAAGLRAVCHAGEHGPAREVQHAVEKFGAERIQHGIAALDDPRVVELLLRESIPCDVCPGSNVALKAVSDFDSHPLPRMVEAGLTVTLGSDDPPLFHTDLLNEYRIAWEHGGLREEALTTMARASISESFAAEEDRERWLAGFEES